jgi:hypothetical protein
VVACALLVQTLIVPLYFSEGILSPFHSISSMIIHSEHSPNSINELAGTFNGVPIYLRQRQLQSHAHCVGDNFHADSYKYRSCHFTTLCYNTASQQFVIFDSQQEQTLVSALAVNSFISSSTTFLKHQAVGIGAVNLKWGVAGIRRLRWSPEIATMNAPTLYYQLPDNFTLALFHSLNAANPGHFLWDDALALYTLVDMFQLSSTAILPLRLVLDHPTLAHLWASCDTSSARERLCQDIIDKFLPLLVAPNVLLTSNKQVQLHFFRKQESELVCANHAVAGIAALSDHGVSKGHGFSVHDYERQQNYGRGGLLYRFRNYMLANLNLPVYLLSTGPRRIVFSQLSTTIAWRAMNFLPEMSVVRKELPDLVVEGYQFNSMSLHEQIQIASQASVYVTSCGGGAVTAMFLPKGSSVIIYYHSRGGREGNQDSGEPALLDWDIFNSMSHLRVHWLPLPNSANRDADDAALVALIQHEIEIMGSGVFG